MAKLRHHHFVNFNELNDLGLNINRVITGQYVPLAEAYLTTQDSVLPESDYASRPKYQFTEKRRGIIHYTTPLENHQLNPDSGKLYRTNDPISSTNNMQRIKNFHRHISLELLSHFFFPTLLEKVATCTVSTSSLSIPLWLLFLLILYNHFCQNHLKFSSSLIFLSSSYSSTLDTEMIPFPKFLSLASSISHTLVFLLPPQQPFLSPLCWLCLLVQFPTAEVPQHPVLSSFSFPSTV